MFKIKDFYSKIKKTNWKKDRKKIINKTTSIILASVATIIYISSNRFNENTEIKAEKELASSTSYEPTTFTSVFNGENADTVTLESGTYKFDNADMQKGIRIQEGATVDIWLYGENTFTGESFNGSEAENIGKGGKAGIYVPEDATLIINGSGSIRATGGNGGRADTGKNGQIFYVNGSVSEMLSKDDLPIIINMKDNGTGGKGAGGGGAAIGTDGTDGGSGGEQAAEVLSSKSANGENSSQAAKPGKIYFLSSGNVALTGGQGGGASNTAGMGMPYNTPTSTDENPNILGQGKCTINKGTHSATITHSIDENKGQGLYRFGGGGGSGGSGVNGKACGTGGSGGGGGGAGGIGACYGYTFNRSDNPNTFTNNYTKDKFTSPIFFDCPHGAKKVEGFSTDDYHDIVKAYSACAYNGGGGGGGGAGGGKGGGGAGGYIHYFTEGIFRGADPVLELLNDYNLGAILRGRVQSDPENKHRYLSYTDRTVSNIVRSNYTNNLGQGGSAGNGGNDAECGYGYGNTQAVVPNDHYYATYKNQLISFGFATAETNKPVKVTAWGGKAGDNTSADSNSGGQGGNGKNKTKDAEPNQIESNVSCTSTVNPNHSYLRGVSAEGFEGGNGGNRGGGEADAENLYCSTNYHWQPPETAKKITNLSSSYLSVVADKGKLKANSPISDSDCTYTWQITDAVGNNYIDDADVNNKEINVKDSYIGKTVKLSMTSSGNGNAMGMNEVSFSFVVDLKECTITQTDEMFTFNESENKYTTGYTGSKVAPQLAIAYEDFTLTEGKHYKLEFFANVDGTQTKIAETKIKDNGTIITAKDDLFSGDFTQYAISPNGPIRIEIVPIADITKQDDPRQSIVYEITTKSLDDEGVRTILMPDKVTYDGNDHGGNDISVTVIYITRVVPANAYELIWPTDMKNAGEKTVTIKAVEGNGYTNQRTATYTIEPYDLNSDNSVYEATLSSDQIEYTGNESTSKPTVTVKGPSGAVGAMRETLVEGEDYTLIWPEDVTSVGEKTVTIEGKGNYKGSFSKKYNVTGTDMNDESININLNVESFEYTGENHKPEITVKKGDQTLNENEEYTVSWPEDTASAGTKAIKLSGNNTKGYSGEATVYYKINPITYTDETAQDWKFELSQTKYYYNGEKIVPTVTVSYKGNELVNGQDYDLVYSEDTTGIGKKSVKVTLKGNYSGNKTLEYEIQNVSREITYGQGLSISIAELFEGTVDLSQSEFEVTNEKESLNDFIYIQQSSKTIIVKPTTPSAKYSVVVTDKNSKVKSFYIDLKINKAVPKLTLNNKTIIYSGENVRVDEASLSFCNDESFGKISDLVNYNYYTDEQCTALIMDAPVNAGTYYAKAYVSAPSNNYENSTSNVATISILKAEQNLVGSTSYGGYPGATIKIDTESDINTNLSYAASDESIASIDADGNMLLLNEGTTTITTYASETDNYNAATFEATLTVDKDLYETYSKGKSKTYNNGGSASGGINGNSSGSSGNNQSGKNSGSESTKDSGTNSSSSKKSEDSDGNSVSNDDGGYSLVDKAWDAIVNTEDNLIYIVCIILVALSIAATIFIVVKRNT